MTALTSINPCGHPFNPPRVVITTHRLDEIAGGAPLQVKSITGGRRVLLAAFCQCGQATYYRQGTGGLESRALDNTPGVIAGALAEVLAEPADVFTVELTTDRAMTFVIPRHHLPLLAVEQW